MKQWNGLLKKEWSAMSGQFYMTVGAAILFTLLIPFGSNLFGLRSALELSLILSIVWAVAGLLIPTILLLISLGKEMSRPDILLHSPASVFKLFGSKSVFAGFVGAINIAIPVVVIIIGSRYSKWLVDFPFEMILKLGVIVYLLLCIQSLLVMGQGLFFGVLYQLLKPVIRGFTVPVVVISFLVSSWAAARVASSTVYEKITAFGPVIGLSKDGFSITEGNHFFEVDLEFMHTGTIVVDLSLAVLLFIVAVVLFEKKVRI